MLNHAAALLLFAVCVSVPRIADAQWFFAGYLGGNATRPSDVTVQAPPLSLGLTFHDVEFVARPLESPQYYGWRLGRMFGGRRLGLEVELIHLKVYARTGESYATTSTGGSIVLAPGQPMTTVVERYAMSHGLNFLVANFIVRHSLGSGRAALIARAGMGPALPHTETTVLGNAVDRYEYAGVGTHVAAGIDVQMLGRLSFMTEYKFTYARPEITISAGTGRMTAATHHVAVGLAFGLSR
jgi:hypothetical protein